MRNLSRVAIFLFIFFLFPLFGQAFSQPTVVINEIAWMGTEVEDQESKNWWRYEWLELYNNTDQLISLDGWKIELYGTELDWSLELKGNISAQDYFLIVASDKIFPNYDLNYSNLGGKFVNSGQKVVLKDAIGTIMDEIDCSSGWSAGSNLTKQTMERKTDGNWQTSQNPGGTPKNKNSMGIEINQSPAGQIIEPKASPPQPESKPFPPGIIINEILPSPEGPDEENEWIEIFNQNVFEINLSNWRITDTAGNTNTYTFPEGTIILSKGFLVVSRPTTKITLNNDGDGLNFKQPAGNIIDTVTYEKAPKGQSYNRVSINSGGRDWIWSSTLTPGSENIVSAPKLFKQETKEEKSEIGTPKVEEKTEKGLATIGEPLRQAGGKQTSNPLIIALAIAIFSGVLILILKRKLKEGCTI